MSFTDYLEKMLIKRGFWSDGDGCWKEINENAESFEDVMKRADFALYEIKHTTKNDCMYAELKD